MMMKELMFLASKMRVPTIRVLTKNRSETILRAVLIGFLLEEGQVIGE